MFNIKSLKAINNQKYQNLLKDDYIYSLIQKRKNGILNRFITYNEVGREEIKSFVPNLIYVVFNAIIFGFSVIQTKNEELLILDNSKIQIKTNDEIYSFGARINTRDQDLYYIIRYNGDHQNPEGVGVLATIYNLYQRYIALLENFQQYYQNIANGLLVVNLENPTEFRSNNNSFKNKNTLLLNTTESANFSNPPNNTDFIHAIEFIKKQIEQNILNSQVTNVENFKYDNYELNNTLFQNLIDTDCQFITHHINIILRRLKYKSTVEIENHNDLNITKLRRDIEINKLLSQHKKSLSLDYISQNYNISLESFTDII